MLHCSKCQGELPIGCEQCPACETRVSGAALGLHQGIRAFSEKRYTDAFKEFTRARQIDPQDADVRRCFAQGLRFTEQTEQAMGEFREVLQRDAENVEARYSIARIHIDQGRLNQARDIFESLIKAPIEFAEGEFLLGQLFGTPDHFRADCCYHIAIACWNQGETEGASHYFERALELDPDHATTLHHLGNLRFQAKDYANAIALYRRFLDASEKRGGGSADVVEARCNLGIALYELGNDEEAVDHLNQVLQARPGHPRAIYHMNLIYEREGMYREEGSAASTEFQDTDQGSIIFGLSDAGAAAQSADGRASDKDTRPIIGKCQTMQRVLRLARLAAASDATALLTGENGTGKELIARSIHEYSNRRDRIFLPVNCAAIPESLIESELFGHEAGSFTGATGRKKGKFEAAHKGTLFLDEIGELDLNMQVKLLRVLQEREFTRVGGNETIRVDVRIIAATNRDLAQMIHDGTFRQDLFFRINVLPIHIPALRERREDIPLLVDYFVFKYGKGSVRTESLIREEDLNVMKDYDWPGNIRELENLIERAMVMGTEVHTIVREIARGRKAREAASGAKSASSPELAGQRSDVSNADVIEISLPGPTAGAGSSSWEPLSIRELERRHIIQMLEHTDGNRAEAARNLGINPTTLWRKMKVYEIQDALNQG